MPLPIWWESGVDSITPFQELLPASLNLHKSTHPHVQIYRDARKVGTPSLYLFLNDTVWRLFVLAFVRNNASACMERFLAFYT